MGSQRIRHDLATEQQTDFCLADYLWSKKYITCEALEETLRVEQGISQVSMGAGQVLSPSGSWSHRYIQSGKNSSTSTLRCTFLYVCYILIKIFFLSINPKLLIYPYPLTFTVSLFSMSMSLFLFFK